MRALQEAGRTIPFDVAITGFDDILSAGLANPPLTTVTQQPGEAGAILVDTLLKLVRKEPAESRMLPARLVVRRSSTG